MFPLQLCAQFYACMVVVSLFGGIVLLVLALLTVYGMGGVELLFTLCFIGLYGLARILLLPPWSASPYSIFSSNEKQQKLFAVDTYTLEEHEEVTFSSCCSICLHNFKAKDRLTMGRVCGHVFHQDCLAMWLPKSTSCPYCRHDLEDRCTSGSPSDVHKSGAWGIFDGLFDSVYA
jgi:hypothetical protein